MEGSRKKRIYDTPQTPFERLKACGQADPGPIEKLGKLKAARTPSALRRSIEKKLRRLLRASAGSRLKAAA